MIDHVNKNNNSTLFRDILALVETNLIKKIKKEIRILLNCQKTEKT